MTVPVKRGSYARKCGTCPWSSTYDTAAKANHAKRRHSCERYNQRAARAEKHRSRMEAIDRTPQPCNHPQADHQHGTYACYTLDACRCGPCAAAVAKYETNRVRQQAYGRWDNLVDAEPARQHVRRLMAAGMGWKRIGDSAGVGSSSLGAVLFGRPRPDGSHRPPTRRISKDAAERLLSADLDLADGARIDSTETARRLQALVANGWSMSKLGARLGIEPQNTPPVVNAARTQVLVSTAKAVHALYIELVDQAPPQAEWRDKISVSRARGHAVRNGWARPLRINGRFYIGHALALPDNEEADAQSAKTYDEATVLRRLSGDRDGRLTKPDRIEVVARARDAGWSYRDIEHRAGISKPDRYIPRQEVAS